jgi:hypothetical protein
LQDFAQRRGNQQSELAGCPSTSRCSCKDLRSTMSRRIRSQVLISSPLDCLRLSSNRSASGPNSTLAIRPCCASMRCSQAFALLSHTRNSSSLSRTASGSLLTVKLIEPPRQLAIGHPWGASYAQSPRAVQHCLIAAAYCPEPSINPSKRSKSDDRLCGASQAKLRPREVLRLIANLPQRVGFHHVHCQMRRERKKCSPRWVPNGCSPENFHGLCSLR